MPNRKKILPIYEGHEISKKSVFRFLSSFYLPFIVYMKESIYLIQLWQRMNNLFFKQLYNLSCVVISNKYKFISVI